MLRNDHLLTRRAMLACSALGLASLSLSRVTGAVEPPKRRRIAVTIDDGPATGATRDLEAFVRISRALRESFVAEKVPAIMFINERQLAVDGERDARVAVLHDWLAAGLELGNHTYSHPNLGEVGPQRFLDDIIKGEVISRPLLAARGRQLVWFRYPFLASGSGEAAKTVEDFLAARGYRIAPVTVDYHDYSFSSAYLRHVRAGNRAGADEQFGTVMKALDDAFARAEARSTEVLGYELPQTLLIHCNEMNALTLPQTIQRMRDRGYTFVTLDEAMEDAAYKTPLRAGGLGGGGLFNSLAAAKRGAAQTG
ncbi:MAG TPA: polysaccharide deacetylase family protein [Opitutaceae bacterium]|nr:polysaccharide deacetylase family protein [Opitutaceae bacterium]